MKDNIVKTYIDDADDDDDMSFLTDRIDVRSCSKESSRNVGSYCLDDFYTYDTNNIIDTYVCFEI